MPEFKFIINPNTKSKVSLYAMEGGHILSKYVNAYKKYRENVKLKTDSGKSY